MIGWFACHAGTETPPVDDTDAPAVQDVVHTHLDLDLAAAAGHAKIEVKPGPGPVRLDVSGLTVHALRVDGATVPITDTTLDAGWLSVPVDAPGRTAILDVDYNFPERRPRDFDGWMPALGVTFVWPYACGNLYPCDPSMSDGVRFSMSVTGVTQGLSAVYPADTFGDGPAYLPAVAVGDYARVDLGHTSAGTGVAAWHLPGQRAATDRGTAHLVAAYDFFEQTYGSYLFGPEAGAVQVDWGADSWGGMEHHPYVHVGKFDFEDEEAQIHEAGHAWFGDGVRLACWEDFVLSEGTTTYIAARASEAVGGDDFWPYYVDDFLVPICEGDDVNTIVLPDSCGEIDFVNDDLWSLATYMKGACFYEEVADTIGAAELDAIIAEFYVSHRSKPARMRDMLALLAARAPDHAADIDAAASDWLYRYECPTDYVARCRAHR
jgi:aminopeptidase N